MIRIKLLRHPVVGIVVVAITAIGLLVFFTFTPRSLTGPYSPHLVIAYALTGAVSIFGVPIVISYRNGLGWAGWLLMALLVISIVGFVVDAQSAFYGWVLLLFVFWPGLLLVYAITTSIEIAIRKK